MAQDPLFGAFAPALRVHGERLGVLAGNLANADTPGYMARDIDFRKVLQNEGVKAMPMAQTRAGHLPPNDGLRVSSPTQWRIPTQPSADGNTVEGPVEQAAYMDAALRYQAALRFIDGRMSSLRTAIQSR
ncbi:MAG: flagellar basal body rod protein FlgB [Oceanococcaceae bacterium]